MRQSAEPKTVNSVLGTDKEARSVRRDAGCPRTVSAARTHTHTRRRRRFARSAARRTPRSVVLGPWYRRRSFDDESCCLRFSRSRGRPLIFRTFYRRYYNIEVLYRYVSLTGWAQPALTLGSATVYQEMMCPTVVVGGTRRTL